MTDLESVFYGTKRLYRTFDIELTKSATLTKFVEESCEFIDALSCGTDAEKLDEFGDVIVTAIGAMIAAGFTYRDCRLALEAVVAKNGDKTDATHEVKDGMIVRKVEE